MSLAENIDFLSLLPKPGDWPLYGRGLRGDVQSPLTEVRGFGSNPGNLRMFAFVPSKLQQPHALVVVLHGCGQTAASYDLGAGWSTLAKHYGFALLLPQQQPSNNPNGCFNWFSKDDIARGRGEAASIRQMVVRMVRDHAIDPRRVFVTGLSAGGAMASVMLAAYPDVFSAGAIIAGLPFGVAGNVREALLAMRTGSGRSGAALGDLVRNASKYRGPWPKVSVWHGSADRTVSPANAGEIVGQWLDVHDLPEAPMSQGVVDGHRRQVWWNEDGQTVVESYAIADMAHGTPLGRGHDDKRYGKEGAFLLEAGISSSYHIAKFFGLTRWIRDAKPTVAESPSAKLIPPVSPISAVAVPDLTKVLRPLITTEQPAESEAAAPPKKRHRIVGDVGAALERVLIAAGLKK
ncbi:PHB depolymerase family esterase [Bradyrhizobium sp. ARR65]|uniref:extracellular catalytic domain type 1 short-chain-length polyhydroxyalkanoate depolymerase n=1 Tax=Bradyrhizobium sp. ARR65 TaxID=1040989 RepID=UPI0004634E0C|nr:PHB depolymerase family esterase [Bradyrhizobium sp. ARR65]